MSANEVRLTSNDAGPMPSNAAFAVRKPQQAETAEYPVKVSFQSSRTARVGDTTSSHSRVVYPVRINLTAAK